MQVVVEFSGLNVVRRIFQATRVEITVLGMHIPDDQFIASVQALQFIVVAVYNRNCLVILEPCDLWVSLYRTLDVNLSLVLMVNRWKGKKEW